MRNLAFSGHSNFRRDARVSKTYEKVLDKPESKNTVIYIVRLKDRIPKKGEK